MSRDIDLRESVVRQQEAMGHTVRTPYQANYLARAVDPLRSREYCPGEIDRGNGLCAERRRECRHRKEGCYYCSSQHELLLGSLLAASGSLSVLPREVVLNVQRQRCHLRCRTRNITYFVEHWIAWLQHFLHLCCALSELAFQACFLGFSARPPWRMWYVLGYWPVNISHLWS